MRSHALHRAFDHEPTAEDLDHEFPAGGISSLRLQRTPSSIVLQAPAVPLLGIAIGFGGFLAALTVAYFVLPSKGVPMPYALSDGRGDWILALVWGLIFPSLLGGLWFIHRTTHGRGPGAVFRTDTKTLSLPWSGHEVAQQDLLRLIERRKITKSGGRPQVTVQGGILFRSGPSTYGYAPIGSGVHRQDLAVLREFAKELGVTVQSIGKVSEDTWAKSNREQSHS